MRKTLTVTLAVVVLSGLAVGSAEGLAGHSAGHSTAARTATHETTATREQQQTCNPKASSLRPDGPPAVSAGSFMATIRARGYLIAGVDQSTYHFGFLNPLNGQTEGFDIDMINAVAKAIFGHADASTVHIKAITDDQRIPAVTSGEVDIVAHTMTITCKRLQQLDFSSVYFDAGQRVLVQTDSAAKSIGDLKGQRVCATQGSTSLTTAESFGAIGVPVPYWTDCLALLQQGDVVAVSTDDSILAGLAAQDPFTKLIGPTIADEPYGLAISKQHPEFVRFVNGVLAQLRSSGQWAASYAHWVGTPVPAPPAAAYAG